MWEDIYILIVCMCNIRVIHEVISIGVVHEIGCCVVLLFHVARGENHRENDDGDEHASAETH